MSAEARQLAGPEPRIEHFTAHFAGQLVAALPGTGQHASAWRNYTLATIMQHEPALNIAAVHPARRSATAATLNEDYHDGVAYAALRNGRAAPAAANLALSLPQWLFLQRRLYGDIALPHSIEPNTVQPAMLLGMLALGSAGYTSLRGSHQRART